MTQPWYQTLFANYARHYDQENFTFGTIGECDFLEQEFNYNKSLRIIDVGCGTARHAIEMTRRGYSVIGIDLSMAQLRRAKEKAALEQLQLSLVQADARLLPFKHCFDAAVMLCEGGFALMETDAMNYAILKSVTEALKPPAKFIFTTLNGLFPLQQCLSVAPITLPPNVPQESESFKDTFDIMTMRNYFEFQFEDDDGRQHTISCNERYYLPSEITYLLETLGYSSINIYGAELGAFSRTRRLTASDFEMLVIAEI